jgi:hypothetical protein
MERKYDPRESLPKPSVYATRMILHTGDLVCFQGQGHLIVAVIDFHTPLTPDGAVGRHYVLRRHDWRPQVYIIIHADELAQPQTFAA